MERMVEKLSELIPPNSKIYLNVHLPEAELRIDVFLTRRLPAYSREFFQKLINGAAITINAKPVDKPSFLLKPDDQVIVHFPPADGPYQPKSIEKDLNISIIAQHEHFLIINKPAGLMVHSPAHESGAITLVDWLLNYFSELGTVGYHHRPGIVHRLDKDTSGLMIIPRNNYSHAEFTDQFQKRLISKHYLAVVSGHPDRQGSINFPIARDPHVRNRMTHKVSHGRDALTHYQVEEYFPQATLIKAHPVTGRTHQIRVHCSGLGYPIIGDTIYGQQSLLIKRQALHARGISFSFKGEHFEFNQNPPEDFNNLMQNLRTEQ